MTLTVVAGRAWPQAAGSAAPEPASWQRLPPTPALPEGCRSATAVINRTLLHWVEIGRGAPVLFLHGGLAHAGWWGHQLAAVAAGHRAIALDTRGHGASGPSPQPFSFALLARDVLGLLDHLGIARCAVVGWSDGAICGLQLALQAPQRLTRLFCFGANFNPAGLRPGGAQAPTFIAYAERCRAEHARLSPAPGDWPQLVAGLQQMWRREPAWTPAELGRIRLPVQVVQGAHDEIILPGHAEALAAAIPGATLALDPDMSHFGLLQAPQRFSARVLDFLRR